MATAGSVIAAASIILDDTGNVRSTPELMRVWYNEACREIARRSECLRAKTTVSTTADTQSVTWAGSCIRIAECYWYGTGDTQRYPLVYRDHRANRAVWGSGRAISVGTPELFWTEGFPGSTSFTIWLYPTPSTNGTLEIHYYRFPTDIATDGSADASTVDLPSGWHDTITPFIVMRAFEAQRQYEMADRWRGEFDNRLTGLIDASVRYVDEPGTVAMDDWYDIFGDAIFD